MKDRRNKETKNKQNRKKMKAKMVDLNQIIAIITLYVNELSILSKGQRLSDLLKKTPQKPTTNLFTRATYQGFPGGAVVKNLPANAGDSGLSPAPGGSLMPQSN